MMYIPGKYYLASRYNSRFSLFFIYLMKYWGTAVLFYEYYLNSTVSNSWFFYCISLLLYFSIYDFFCYINDSEPGAITERSGQPVLFSQTILCFFMFSSVGLLFYGVIFFCQIFICLILSCIFFFHNKASEKIRVFTYFSLYFLKPFLFFTDFSHFLSVSLFSCFYALSYVPYYAAKKFGMQWSSDFYKVFFSGIFLKCLFLAIFIPFSLVFLFIIFWQLILTLFDYLLSKKVL